jgi:hypothetical protein
MQRRFLTYQDERASEKERKIARQKENKASIVRKKITGVVTGWRPCVAKQQQQQQKKQYSNK